MSHPTDFTWNELRNLLNHMGFEQISGSGSRYKFVHHGMETRVISLHKPHPGSIVKSYVLKEVEATLKDLELI